MIYNLENLKIIIEMNTLKNISKLKYHNNNLYSCIVFSNWIKMKGKNIKHLMTYNSILDDKPDSWIKVWKFLYISLATKVNIIVKYQRKWELQISVVYVNNVIGKMSKI